MRRDTGGLGNEAFTSNPIVSSKQKLKAKIHDHFKMIIFK